MANIETTLKWMEDRIGKVTYSQAQRKGPNSYDCSSAVYYALWAGDFTTRINYAGNTENLFKEKGYLTTEIRYEDRKRGDLFIAGNEGSSGGDFGHTGFVWDRDHIIHCNYTSNGIAITPINGRTGSPVRWFRIKGANPSKKWDIENRTDEEIAKLIYDQTWKLNGDERKQVLGDRWRNVQDIINAIAKGKTVTTTTNKDAVLTYNGAKLDKDTLDLILKLCKEYDILPEFAITILHFEGLWGNSAVGKADNNWGGMTYTGESVRKSGIAVSKGTARPTKETGYYMHYASVSDFLKDWFYLLRADGSYKVAGKTTFAEAVKGMFIAGGANYDYASIGYSRYITGAKNRLYAIEKENGSLADLTQTKIEEGWQLSSAGWWYQLSNGDYYKDCWQYINQVWYRFNQAGYILEKQWLEENGNWYYFKKGGYMAQSEILNIDGKQCYFDDSGVLKTETTIY